MISLLLLDLVVLQCLWTPATITDNNDITVLQGDQVLFYNFTPGVPTAFGANFVNPGTGYAASGTGVATTGGSGTGLTVDFTAFDGIIETLQLIPQELDINFMMRLQLALVMLML